MFRVLNLVSVAALIAAAVSVYHLKYSSAFEAQEIAQLRTDIRKERDRIAVLNAEWARRTAPDRVQALAEHHLDMIQLDVDHMNDLASLPAKPDTNGDGLGGMIEALIDGPAITGAIPKPDRPQAPKPSAGAATTPPQAVRPAAPAATAAAPAVRRAPLPLSALPAAGVMGGVPGGPAVPAPTRSLQSAPVTSSAPLLPPAPINPYGQ